MAKSKVWNKASDDEYFRYLSKMQRASLNKIDFTTNPAWMIEGSIGDDRWITKGAMEDDRNITIRFNHPLPDGHLLTDPPYSKLLLSIQKNAYALRLGYTGAVVDPRRWSQHINWEKKLASWLVLHAEEYNPKKLGFNSFDENAVKLLTTELAEGNWATALQYTNRFLEILHNEVYGVSAPEEIIDSPFHLPKDFFSRL